MKIAVTVNFQFSYFSAGTPVTALAIGEALRSRGHTPTLLGVGDPKEGLWWDDVKGLASEWQRARAVDLAAAQYDLVIEVSNHLLTSAQRAAAACPCVWLCRRGAIFHDIEASLFPFENPLRDLEAVAEIWVTDEMTSADDIQYLEVLTRKTVRRVPFLWTPSAIEFHRREMNAPVWPQVLEMPDVAKQPWSVHICETNTSSASSCTIPLFILREVRLKTQVALAAKAKIHNAEHVKKSEFFRFNVLNHAFSDVPDISGDFLGRQRVVDWVYDPKSVILAHSRFTPLRQYVLDAMWVGIPVVHNCTLLREFGGYYPDNDISAGRVAFEKVTEGAVVAGGVDRLMDVRRKILEQFSCLAPGRQAAWEAASIDVVKKGVVVGAGAVSEATTQRAAAPLPTGKPLRVGFCDMWDGFRPEYNFFTLLLEAAAPGRPVIGSSVAEGIDLVIFGPFGDKWKTIATTVPKVHYTGENTPPVIQEDVKLNLGYKHMDGNHGNYLRLPLWMLEINWFGADSERIGNPKPLPLARVLKPAPMSELGRHSKFAAFVVTNPCQPMRNAAFHWLSGYKPVDSAGRLFNNVGDGIFAGLGGGGGELRKHEFLKDYKFCLAYENAAAPGYTTEKLLHAKAAGCVPIYWGDPRVERDFDTNGFIDARDFTTSAELVQAVQKVDTDPAEWLRIYGTPALNEVRRDLARRTLGECARRMWRLVDPAMAVPEFLGLKEDPVVAPAAAAAPVAPAPAPAAAAAPAAVPATTASWDTALFITAANSKFLESLNHLLSSLEKQRLGGCELNARVYLFPDVPAERDAEIVAAYPFVEIRRFPKEAPATFADQWAPEHFAWKLWLLANSAADPTLAGRPALYMDAGTTLCRWPRAWLSAARSAGVAVLEDPRQDNEHWCHAEFRQALAVTGEELKAKQIWAGSIAFVGGAPLACKLFWEAWTWGQKRAVIAGAKWAGMAADGKPYGHRHDQSILSVVSGRLGVPRVDLDSVYCDVSIRETFLRGAAIYCHRGYFILHKPVAADIDDVWVINLDRRADRLKRVMEEHPDIRDRMHRLSAFEGRGLTLTPRIKRLFAPHDFAWKKPVMGCALSHLALWNRLVKEPEEIQSYLILEDDARLRPGWLDVWRKAQRADAIPSDWDVIYLGGILPPNKAGFEACTEKVNEFVGRIKLNQVFGQNEPNRYFHFCAYSYVLSRRGAEKVLKGLRDRGGYWTSADHMICNIQDVLNIYFMNPLLGGCYQDDDPRYQNSQFNDFSRVDGFDSDLWNNTERFSEAEVAACATDGLDLDIEGALADAADAPAATATVDVVIGAAPPAPAELVSTVAKVAAPPPLSSRRMVSVAGPVQDVSKWYEFSWFKQILWDNARIALEVERLDGEQPPTDSPIIVVQRPHVDETRLILARWAAAGATFYVLHLSDEFGKDPIDFYDWPACLGVVRNYVRPDLPAKARVIPLGFHWAIPNGEPAIHTPRPPFRELAWSFIGTGWAGRREKLAPLVAAGAQIGESRLVFMDEWNSPAMLGREETLAVLLNTWCVPCPAGNNVETFRIYEALEAGAIPVLVKEGGQDAFFTWLGRWLPLLAASSWQNAAEIIFTLKSKPEVYEQYRSQLMIAWEVMKGDARKAVREAFQVGV
jgi:GR25 family glycosyltransferase involved in LPS biosynthesis